MRKTQLITLILISYVFTACSRIEMGYKFADNLAASQMDSSFDLSSQQKSKYKQDFQKELEDWRQNGLPAILKYMEDCKSVIMSGPSYDNTLSLIKNGESLFYDQINFFTPSFFTLASDLTELQWKHFDAYSKERDQDQLEDIETPHLEMKEQKKRLLQTFEFFIGDLSKQEENLLNKFCEENPYPLKQQFTERTDSRKMLMDRTLPERVPWMKERLKNRSTWRSPDLQKKVDQYQASLARFLSDFFGTKMTSERRAHIIREIDLKIQDLNKIRLRPTESH